MKLTTIRLQVSTILVAILIVFGLSAMPVNASFSINQQLVEVQAHHNENSVGVITVSNYSDEPMNICVIPADYIRDSEGGVDTPAAGETRHSLFPYVSLSSTYISLEPNSSHNLEYVINLSEEVQGSRWFALYFEPDLEPSEIEDADPDKANFFIQVVVAYRTLILATAVGTEEPNGSITGMRIIEEPAFGFEVDLHNTGNVYYRATGWLDIRDERGETVTTLSIERSFVLPDQMLTIRVIHDELRLSPGKYLALAVIDFGGDQLVAGQLIFNVN